MTEIRIVGHFFTSFDVKYLLLSCGHAIKESEREKHPRGFCFHNCHEETRTPAELDLCEPLS